MKRPIKFRGQLPTGKFVFGDLVQWGGFEEPRICSWDNGVIYDIAPESVKQLVGFDCERREVYEDDILIDTDSGQTCFARLQPLIDFIGCAQYFTQSDYNYFKLKEAN